jgi:hypothetical protein
LQGHPVTDNLPRLQIAETQKHCAHIPILSPTARRI